MEIIVIGGCPKEDLSKYVFENINFGEYNTKLMKDNKEHTPHVYLRFPECSHEHPKTCFDDVLRIANDCINNDESLYVATFSEKVLNAVRVAITKSEKDIAAECHQLYDNGNVCISSIYKDGSLAIWQRGVWDAWDEALERLF